MSIVIVEGVDGSGKSTLIRKLREQSKRYFWIASSSSRPKTLPDLQDALHWVGQASYLKLPIVCDRFPLISEVVYGPILRGSNLLDQLNRRDQASAAALLSEVDRIIYCRPHKDVIKENLSKNLQMDGVKNRLGDLINRYDDVMDSLRDDNIYVIGYDYTKNVSPLEGLFFGRI